MDDPAKQDKPECRGQHKHHDGKQQPTLQQLAEAGDEETSECGNDIAGGSLSWSHECAINE